MKKFTIIILSILFLNGCQEKEQIPKVAILQDKPQEWADALKLGFIDGLEQKGYIIGTDIIIVPRSGASDPVTFSTIAEGFVKGDYPIIYTLGTQSTQEIFNLTKDKNIIFGAVTDPVAAGFFKDNLSSPIANITGTQDLWPYPAQFDLIQALLPNLKTIGIIYNPSEVNSQVSVEFISNECAKRNIQLEKRTVSSESDILQATSSLVNQKVDLLFIPADNTAQTAATSIIAICDKNKIPVFTGINGIVELGAIATVGTNYYELGKVNAQQAIEILFNEKRAKDISVSIAEKGDIYINLQATQKFGIIVPDSILKAAFKIYK
ncbi:MAG: ABC transporter substrate-binding protein [Chitinophagales bacterium]|nr:ABC transporter substrate-binding protein [Chitinophagales bacterium]